MTAILWPILADFSAASWLIPAVLGAVVPPVLLLLLTRRSRESQRQRRTATPPLRPPDP